MSKILFPFAALALLIGMALAGDRDAQEAAARAGASLPGSSLSYTIVNTWPKKWQ